MKHITGNNIFYYALLCSASALALTIGAAGQGTNSDAMETITVTGYRASLERSLEMKRESVGVRDSIVAEDIGKYPAANVAESLARVPGVVIARDTRTDEGKSVTVRGLNASYTIVTINGNPVRMVTGTSVGSNNRSVDLDALGADLFSRVDFYKSPQANLDEGGIGGVVDMRTPHPFDYDEMKATYSLGYSMNTNRNKAMPKMNLQFSDTWGPFGALLAFTFSENAYQVMGSEATGWGQSRNSSGTNVLSTTFDYGPDNGGYDSRADIGDYSVSQIQQAYIPRFISRQHLELEDRTRYSGLLSLEYKPGDKLDISFDLMAAELLDKRSEYTLGAYFRSTSTSSSGWASCQSGATVVGSSGCSGVIPLDVQIDSNNNLYGTFANMGWVNENRWYDGDTKYINGTFNAKYNVTDNFNISGVGSIGDNNAFYSDNRIYFYMYNTTVIYNPAGNYKFPEVSTTADMTNPALYSNPALDANIYKEGDRVITGKLDGDYAIESGINALGHVDIKSGISWVSSQKTNDKKSNGSVVYNTATVNGKTLSSMSISDYAISKIPVTNFLDGTSHGTRVMEWATIPRSFYEKAGMNNILEKQTSSLSNVFNITEAVESAYLQADTNGTVLDRNLRISAGLRFAKTRLWGYNYGSGKDTSGSTFYTQVRIGNSYDNFLPTFSVAYDLMESLVLRAAYGKTITRPSLGNIGQATTISSRFNAAASSGNPNLKPLTANNFDLGVEWYFAPESVLSVGVFYKDLKNLISTKTETVKFSTLNLPWSSLDSGVFGTTEDPDLSIQMSHPVNLNPMQVKGFEVSYQQPFSFLPAPFDGLGTMLSFTYTAGSMGGTGTGFTANDGSVYRMQITGLSTYTYSATGYYEKGPYSLRMSYNWHSKSPSSSDNYYNTDLRLWNQARGSLDMTVGYDISDMLEIRMDATNLLDAQEYAFLADGTQGHATIASGNGTSRINYDYLHGTTFTVSLRGRF